MVRARRRHFALRVLPQYRARGAGRSARDPAGVRVSVYAARASLADSVEKKLRPQSITRSRPFLLRHCGLLGVTGIAWSRGWTGVGYLVHTRHQKRLIRAIRCLSGSYGSCNRGATGLSGRLRAVFIILVVRVVMPGDAHLLAHVLAQILVAAVQVHACAPHWLDKVVGLLPYHTTFEIVAMARRSVTAGVTGG